MNYFKAMQSCFSLIIGRWLYLRGGPGTFWLPCFLHVVLISVYASAWPYVSRLQDSKCPSDEWNVMCRSCCEYEQIRCQCPSQGVQVGYAVPCCRNALDQCDPCIIHQGCTIFENCKTCNNGTWQAQDDFYVREQYCTECRQGWSGGDCMKCGGVIRRRQGHVTLESYPINARCEWTLHVNRGSAMELRFTTIDLEFDHSCRYDYVEVRDGNRVDSPVIGRYCGNESPPPIISSGETLRISFVSDGYNNFDGFFATFQEVSACSSSPCRHGATCFLDPVQAFRCACPADYTGQRCETPVPLKKACGIPPKPLDGDLSLLYDTSGNVLSRVRYSCHKSYRLQGTSERTCLSNGTWSAAAPTCVKEPKTDNCPVLAKLQHGFYKTLVHETPRTVEFHCRNSYALSGNPQRSCRTDGSWSGEMPQCVRACREPKVSKLVRQKIIQPHVALRRNTSIHGIYSLDNLRIPGTALLSNEIAAIGPLPKGFHPVFTQIEYECASSLYEHFGSARRTCLKTGKWSGQHVSCSPVCGKLRSASPPLLADTEWPWHAAIYQRVLPGHGGASVVRTPSAGVSTTTSNSDRSISGRRGEVKHGGGGGGGPERWHLVCSGTLVNQYSVLVAAHCVTGMDSSQHIGAADVKVVMGKQSIQAQMETGSHDFFRVAAILVHPNYDPSGPDADLALLKLLDKARISEHVTPACLPRLQGGEVTAQQGYAIHWHPDPIVGPHANAGAALSVRTGLIKPSDVAQCERQYRSNGLNIMITDNMLCGRQHPISPSPVCYSTTGGVVVAQAPPAPRHTGPSPWHLSGMAGSEEGTWELLGLVSYGHKQQTCNPDFDIVYTRVNNFKDWIEKNMK